MRNTCFREWHPPEFFVFTQHGFRFVWRFRRPCWNAIPLARQPLSDAAGPRFRRSRRVRVTRFSQVVRRPSLGLQLGLRALECHSSSTRMRSAPPHPIPFYEHKPRNRMGKSSRTSPLRRPDNLYRKAVMSRKVRIGIIGCGAIAERLHVPEYAGSPDAEIVAFCDVIKSKAQALAERFAPDAEVYSDYTTFFKKAGVEGVSVCLPNHLHGPVTIAALKAGCNVLVEKPMATSVTEARRMLDAADKAGKLLAVNQSQRLFPAHVKAKEVMDSGIMGKVLHVAAMFGPAGPEYWSPTGKWFFNKRRPASGPWRTWCP